MATQQATPTGTRRHRAWPIRVLLVLAGLALIVLGTAAWSLSEVYRGDVAGEEPIYSDEGGSVQVHGEGEVIFEGTQEEVDAFVEEEQGSPNRIPAMLMFVGGGALVLFGILPGRRLPERTPEAPSESIMSA